MPTINEICNKPLSTNCNYFYTTYCQSTTAAPWTPTVSPMTTAAPKTFDYYYKKMKNATSYNDVKSVFSDNDFITLVKKTHPSPWTFVMSEDVPIEIYKFGKFNCNSGHETFINNVNNEDITLDNLENAYLDYTADNTPQIYKDFYKSTNFTVLTTFIDNNKCDYFLNNFDLNSQCDYTTESQIRGLFWIYSDSSILAPGIFWDIAEAIFYKCRSNKLFNKKTNLNYTCPTTTVPSNDPQSIIDNVCNQCSNTSLNKICNR